MPTELEFIEINPNDVGVSTLSNATLLYSGSLNQGWETGSILNASASIYPPGSGNTLYISTSDVDELFPPYIIVGMCIPYTMLDGTKLKQQLKQITGIRFDWVGGTAIVEVIERQAQQTYLYLRLKPTSIAGMPNPSGDGFRRLTTTLIFSPYLPSDFTYNDFNPLISNASENRRNNVIRVVDRNTANALPQNMEAIKNFTAGLAQIPNSNYSVRGLVNGRYEGSTFVTGSVLFSEQAINLSGFESSTHPLDSDVATIASIQLSDRKLTDTYFTPKRTTSVVNSVMTGSFTKFPELGDILYEESGNRFVRLTERRVYSTDTDEIYSTNDRGVIRDITSST